MQNGGGADVKAMVTPGPVLTIAPLMYDGQSCRCATHSYCSVFTELT